MNTDAGPVDFPSSASIRDPTSTPNQKPRGLVLDVVAHAGADEPLIQWHHHAPLLDGDGGAPPSPREERPRRTAKHNNNNNNKNTADRRSRDTATKNNNHNHTNNNNNTDDDDADPASDDGLEPFSSLPLPAKAFAGEQRHGRSQCEEPPITDTPAATPKVADLSPTAAAKPSRHQISVRSQPRHVFVVDASRVWHLPPPNPATAVAASGQGGGATSTLPVPLTPHVLCEHFDVKNPTLARCPRGTRCEFVHADVRGAPRYSPHTIDGGLAGLFEGYRASQVGAATVRVILPPASMLVAVDAGANANADDSSRPTPTATTPVAARTTPAGAMTSTASSPRSLAPQSPRPTALTLSHGSEGFDAPLACLLRTRALQYPPTGADVHPSMPTVTQCAHFAAKRKCDRGVRCKFAHVLPRPPTSDAALGHSQSGSALTVGASARGAPAPAVPSGSLSWTATNAAGHRQPPPPPQHHNQVPAIHIDGEAATSRRSRAIAARDGSACASVGDSSRMSMHGQQRRWAAGAQQSHLSDGGCAQPGYRWGAHAGTPAGFGEHSSSLPIPAAGASMSGSRWTAGTLGASVGSVHAASVWRRDPYAASPRSLNASNTADHVHSPQSFAGSAHHHHHPHHHHHHQQHHHHHHHLPPPTHAPPAHMNNSTPQAQHWVPVFQPDKAPC